MGLNPFYFRAFLKFVSLTVNGMAEQRLNPFYFRAFLKYPLSLFLFFFPESQSLLFQGFP